MDKILFQMISATPSLITQSTLPPKGGSVVLPIFYISLVYFGTICYVIASYFHLKMNKDWVFWKAYLLAIPLVFIEYIFTLHGNHYLYSLYDYSPIDILIITICFYFINIWLLNYFVLQNRVGNIYKEILCFGLIITAFVLTTVIK